MDAELRRLASEQADVVAAWQLRAAGWSWDRIRHHAKARGWRRVHSGVYVLSSSPLTRIQLWFAAALSAPETAISHGSAGACYGFYRFEKPYEVVTRRGRGGKRRHGRLLVFRRAEPQVTRHHGIPITTPEQTLADLAPGLSDRRLGRAFREAARLRLTNPNRILDRCGDRPARLVALAARYTTIPYARCRSDAEAMALEVLHDAGIAPPRVNVRVAGEEADLVWPDRKLIVELDGPQYHRFKDEDARKTARWREAGFEVTRLPTDDVYDAPEKLVVSVRSSA